MSDSVQRHNCFGIIVRVLSTVVLFAVAITTVWVRSGRTIAKESSLVHHSSSDTLVVRDYGLMLVSNATQVAQEEERVWIAKPVAIQEPAEERVSRHHPRAEYSRVTTRSRNDRVEFQDNQFKAGPSMSKNRAPMFVLRGKLIKKIPHSIYHRRSNTSVVVDENLNDEAHTPQVLNKTNIRLNHRQINNYDYPSIQIDETVADTDILNNNQNAYDLIYSVNEKGSEENSIERSGWTTFYNGSEKITPGGLWFLEKPEISSSSNQPSFRLPEHSQNKNEMEYRFKQYDANRNPKIPEGQLLKHISPTYKIDFETQPFLDTKKDNLILQPLKDIPDVQNNILSLSPPTMIKVPTINETLWRTIGLIGLIKLGFAKLKVIGFIKILYFLLFKLKFVLIVLFLKFFSLLKFIKFSSLPLLFLPLAAIIFLIAMKTFPEYRSLILDINNNSSIFSTANTPIPNNVKVMNLPNELTQFTEEIISTPGQSTSQTVFVPPDETVVIPSDQTETIVVPSGQTQVITNSGIPPDVIDAFENLGQRYESLEVMDPTLDLFQKELNSEKCVERIACKIATTGKTGIIPLWINWVLHRVSKPVPSDKLLYFLKAYDDVTNEIHMKSPSPDNWETWCFERYDCNNTDTKF